MPDGLKEKEDGSDWSPMDRVIDAVALASHDHYLSAGNDGYDFDDNDGSSLIDLMRDVKTRQIHVSLFRFLPSGPELLHAPEIEHEGQTHRVPKLPISVANSLILPTGVADYGKTLELFKNIESFLHQHLALSEKQYRLLAYWCIATWFPDFLAFVPRLTVTGEAFAADHFFRVLRCVCWKPILLAGINSAVLQAIAVEQLRPTLFIFEPNVNKSKIQLLNASDQPGYLIAHGKNAFESYCAKCIYTGEHNEEVWNRAGIHVHIAARRVYRAAGITLMADTQLLQNQLFRYRCMNHDLVGFDDFEPRTLSPEASAVALQLGAAIIDDRALQQGILDLVKEKDEQDRADRTMAVSAMVLKAVLHHCHEGEQQRVHVRELAATVNNLYRNEGESTKLSNERLGHVLKNLGLYTRRLNSAGRGLVLDSATRIRAHELSYVNEVLPEVPLCGHCQILQIPEND
jgi:hypothetical protein